MYDHENKEIEILHVHNGLALIEQPCCECGELFDDEMPLDDVGTEGRDICPECKEKGKRKIFSEKRI